ncbi:(3S,6E)-nerolidol synthase 1-like [Zingiber officinale]|uniref:(3S,6E)-nerolidol synthase 1-like n=1 Tax=Zingiber officinale TaxID=94328 RepID=UPI001C4BB696|nr:(3S,6E)-nerolidol synthase 1-like [Zingiber officinale]
MLPLIQLPCSSCFSCSLGNPNRSIKSSRHKQQQQKQQKLVVPITDDRAHGEIRNMLCDARSSSELMLAIDCVQKLDVEHHFEEEIVAALESLYRESYADQLHRRVNTLHEAALLFRLLRQTRYPVSSDIFLRFTDHKRGEFMPSLTGGSHGIVSLLEASYLNTGEGILYEANRFATHHLNSSMPHFAPHFAKFIRQTLAHPYHVSLQSYRARRFLVSLGGGEQGRRKIVEEFARRDFKEVQLLHLQELEQVTSWWETLGLARELKFARDQPSKWYTWSMTVLSNPKFSSYRVALTKVIAFVYLIDDIFDVYGSLDELKLFVKAMNKWELSANIDPLPICMKITYTALFETTNEIAQMIYKEHGWNPMDSLKNAWIELCNAFLVEAKWFEQSQVPTSHDYFKNGIFSCGVPVVLIHIYFLLGQAITHENVSYLETYPNLISCPATILRLWDDLGSAKDEEQDGKDGSFLECFMKENPHCSFEVAKEEVMRLITKAWEELNKESFSSSTKFSRDFVKCCLNTARMVRVMYSYNEKHKLPMFEDYVNLLLIENF